MNSGEPLGAFKSEPRVPSLQPGDLLDIRVFRQQDLSLTLRVRQSGRIPYPLVGPVQAAGRTTGDLQRVLREKLGADYLQDPQVTVTVKEYVPRRVYILGGVKKPAGYELPPTKRITLLQLISSAGGFTDRAYKEFVHIVRRGADGERVVIRLSLTETEKALAQGRAEADPELWPDDLVVIPSGARVVYVLGAVKRPGWFEIPSDTRISVSQAISRVGSFTKFAATGEVIVLRRLLSGEAKKIAVDLDEILDGKLELDIDLLPGDVVWVQERGIF